jgi:hypothetical protein
MPELGSSGSVRGARGNPRSYRDILATQDGFNDAELVRPKFEMGHERPLARQI